MTIVTALGNAGFAVTRDGACVLVDPFFEGAPRVPPVRSRDAGSGRGLTLILITHDHWDHFNADKVIAAARNGAVVGGGQRVIRKLEGRVPAEALVELEPASPGPGEKCKGLSFQRAGAAVTAFRTFHSHGHNSYLVDMGGVRFFHDGDNERTQLVDPAALGKLDAVMLCCWQGSGWVEFLDALNYRHWLLMHLDEEELDAHERRTFLPPLCARVPRDAIALRPGQSLDVG